MDKIRIQGGKPLKGAVQVSGSKNAALPILVASLLSEGECVFKRVPSLEDIRTVLRVVEGLGMKVELALEQNRVRLRPSGSSTCEADYELVRKMRASVLVLGPLLARYGKAKVSLPGGCAIGTRPVNFHLVGLKKLGAQIELEQGYILAKASRLQGARVPFEFPSVGATEHLMMAASLAKGETVLENCAREPEIVDLADALRAMGAVIEGDGTETIRIQGRESLDGCEFEIMGDRIEAGTFLAAAVATRGDVTVEGLAPVHLEAVLAKLEEAGAQIERGRSSIRVVGRNRARGCDLTTQPFPGFPTDMQAQFMSIAAVADGTSAITETIFENRFMHVPELMRLGADIRLSGNTAIVRGVDALKGAPVMATDLRASASLVISGLCAEGETIVNRVYHLDRGYERMERKLAALGAQIERVK
ncbi:MAG: UDP-N-acetylglucosamine 1-carboxyvinyltransferase [Bdellovibrionales bacterium]|nr:UDP-N-acetylglucosamine 1-carboxyvinyltransferase [Bdellovibrionales bacterium]